MANWKILSKEPISLVQVKKVLSQSKKDRDLTYREDKIKEYVKNLDLLSLTEFEKAKKEIEELEIPRLGKSQIIKILDVLPQTGTVLRAIVSNSGTILIDKNADAILSIIKKYY